MASSPIPILYEDDQYVVFDKPSGLIVIPSPKGETRTLVSLVNDQTRKQPDQPKLFPCHRLDRDTSGTILFAKGKKNQKTMMEAFKNKAVQKRYIALANGNMHEGKGKFESKVISLDKAKWNLHAAKKSALTEYSVIQNYRNFCKVEIMLGTGRSNQIRIHFAKAGHPLVGERKYAIAKKYPYKFRRVALHAYSLQWLHPATKKNIIVKSQLPKDLEDFISKNL